MLADGSADAMEGDGADGAVSDSAVLDAPPSTVSVAGHAVAALHLSDEGYSPVVVTFTTTPLASRHVAILDANGVLTNLTTDGAGAFSATGVATPYDVVVFPSPENPSAPPIAYLSLTTPHPRLGAPPDAVVPAVPLYVNFYAPVTIPAACGPCVSYGCSSCQPSLEIAPTGAALVSLRPTQNFIAVTFDLSGDGGVDGISFSYAFAGPNSTALTLDLVLDPANGNAYYAEQAIALPPDAGNSDAAVGPVTLNELSLARVGTRGTLSTVLSTVGVSTSDWVSSSAGAWVNFPSGNSLPLISNLVWDIPGTTLMASILGGETSSASFAWSGIVPPPSVSPTLKVYGPPIVTVPTTLTPTNGQITWAQSSSQQLLFMDLDRQDDGGSYVTECKVVTFGDTLDLAKLAALGVTIDSSVSGLFMWGYGSIGSLDALVDEGMLAVPDGTQATFAGMSVSFVP